MDTPQQTEAKLETPAVSNPLVLNPLAEPISHFEDDPFWDEMMDAIRRNRQELDAAWDTTE